MSSNLNLPIIIKNPPPHSLRSIDIINKWIEHDYLYFFDRKIYEKQKKLNSVNVKFVLTK